MANSVDPDQTPSFAASDLGIRCFQMPIFHNIQGFCTVINLYVVKLYNVNKICNVVWAVIPKSFQKTSPKLTIGHLSGTDTFQRSSLSQFVFTSLWIRAALKEDNLLPLRVGPILEAILCIVFKIFPGCVLKWIPFWKSSTVLSTSFRKSFFFLLRALHKRSKFANFCHDLMQTHLS